MKKLTMVLIAIVIGIGLHPPGCTLNAQEAPQPALDTAGFSIPFSVGQDNAYLCQSGKCFYAVGAGVDVLGYEKALGSKGSILDIKLHGMALAKVSDNETGQLYGAAITLDMMRLITGAKVDVLIDKLSLLLGPAVAYDADKGSIAYGGMVNLSYTF